VRRTKVAWYESANARCPLTETDHTRTTTRRQTFAPETAAR